MGRNLNDNKYFMITIINNLPKKLAAFLLAIRTNAKKIKPMVDNLKPGFFGKLPCHVSQTLKVRVYDFFAVGTNQVRMGKWFIPIIPITTVRESQLKDLVNFLKQGYGLIYCRTAGCREIDFYLFIYCFN